MSTGPERIKSRGAAIAALSVTVALLALVLGTPVLAAFWAQRAERDDALHELGVYQAELAARPALEAEYKSLNLRGAKVPGVIEGDSTALAQAELQSQLRALVDANKGEVRSIQILPVATQSGFEVISAQCDLEIPESHLRDLAYAIGVHAPYFFIDEVTITAPPSEPDDVQKRQSMLSIRWSVHGFRWTRPR